MTTVPHLTAILQELFTATAERLARRTGFVRRRSKLTGALFAQTLVFGWLADPQISLCGLGQVAAALGVAISAQSFDERFTEAAAVFLEELLTRAVQQVIAADAVAIPLLERFSAVVLLDSSTISLPAALAPWWRGCTPGTAALKLHVRYDLCRGKLSGLVVREGRVSDHCTPLQTAPLPRGALRLSDLGFFALQVFAQMSEQGVYWLSRLASGTAVYTVDGRRWEVLALLERQGRPTADLEVTLGVEQRLAGRLLAERVPSQVAQQRRRRLRAEAKRRGRTKTTYLGAQYRRIAARRGAKRAAVAVAVAHSILVIVYHVLTRHEPYRDLGVAYFDERDRRAVERRLVKRLQGLGYEVSLQPTAAA